MAATKAAAATAAAATAVAASPISAWSSHSFGLALDFKLTVDKDATADHKGLEVKEANTKDAENLMSYYSSPVMKWLAMNAPKFDFHPYMMEPWHYEYNPVGMAEELIQGAKAFVKK